MQEQATKMADRAQKPEQWSRAPRAPLPRVTRPAPHLERLLGAVGGFGRVRKQKTRSTATGSGYRAQKRRARPLGRHRRGAHHAGAARPVTCARQSQWAQWKWAQWRVGREARYQLTTGLPARAERTAPAARNVPNGIGVRRPAFPIAIMASPTSAPRMLARMKPRKA